MLNSEDITDGGRNPMTISIPPEITLKRIQALVQQRQLPQAQQVCQQLLSSHVNYAPAWFFASIISSQLGNPTQALTQIDKALALTPANVPWQLHKIQLLMMLRMRDQARALAEQLAAEKHQQPRACAELALVLNKLGLHELSLDYYQQALALAPGDPQILFNLASLQRYMGKLTEAENSLEQLITKQPQDCEAWLLRSSLRKQTADNNHINALKIQLEKDHEPIAKAQLYYALAKELEDLQQFDDCFNALQQGARIRRQNMQYQPQGDLATLSKIAEVFAQKLFNQARLAKNRQGYGSDQPIFILGLPRTGSTLVERILSSHSDVFSAGELNNFAIEMMAQVRQTASAPPKDKLALIEQTQHLDFAKLGESYVNSTQPDTLNQRHFIDKLPLNSLYVGLIHLALPNAKIIYIKRNPMDTSFAIYKQLFTNGYPFSYDLDELAQYIIGHHQLMQHWQQVLPDAIYTVEYEKLVADVDTESRKLLQYCQLPWQDQCADFANNSSAATTASAAQVRQPIYNSSIGKWQQFASQLQGVKQQFAQAGLCCD